MSDTLITDKFSLPSSWNIEILNNLTELIIDGTHFTPNYVEAGVPFLRVTDIQDKEIKFDNLKFISSEEHKLLSKRCNPVRGDILYSKNGTIGIPKIVDWDWEFSVFVSLCLIKLQKSKLNSEYLKFILQSDLIKWQIHRRAKQGTVTNLHLEEIRELEVPALKLPHQRKIARILTTVDNIIEKTEVAIAKYKAIKQGMMHDLFTRGIDVTSTSSATYGKLRPKFEDAPQLYKESGSTSLTNPIPKEWDDLKFADICTVNQGLQIPISSRFKNEGQNRYVYITIQFLNNPEDDAYRYYIEDPTESVVCHEDDILMTRTGNTGKVISDIVGVFHNNFFKVGYKRDNIKAYIVYHLERVQIQNLIMNFAGTTTIPDLKHSDFYKLPFPKPKPVEQDMIAQRLRKLDAKIVNEQCFLQKLKVIKQGLMQDLLTGKKEVTPDPEDFKEMEN